jgi:hypothetical protein
MKIYGGATMGIITKLKMDIGQAKDIENALATQERRDAILEYIAACDHPEIFEETEEVENE